MASHRLIRMREVCQRTSLSRAHIYRLAADGKFPKPVIVSGKRRAFVEAEIDEWIAKRIATRDMH